MWNTLESGNNSIDEILEGTGKYSDVGGDHTTAQSVFKGNANYGGKNAFSVSMDKLDDIAKNIDGTDSARQLHNTITKNQRRLYTEFANTGQRLTFDDIVRIETKSMTDAGVPLEYAQTWTQQSADDLIGQGITNNDVTNIPWNGTNN